MKIFKTKEPTPIIFEEERHKDSFFISPYEMPLSIKYATLKEINSDGYASILETPFYSRYNTRGFSVMLIPGVLMINSYWSANPPYIAIICKDKKGNLKGAFYKNDLSGTHLSIFNKFFKRYGITRKDIIILTKNELLNNFLWPISAEIKDYNEDYQKELSSKFLKN